MSALAEWLIEGSRMVQECVFACIWVAFGRDRQTINQVASPIVFTLTLGIAPDVFSRFAGVTSTFSATQQPAISL